MAVQVSVAKPEQAEDLARAGTAAFMDDPMDSVFYKHRRKHPKAYLAAYTKMMSRNMKRKDTMVLAATIGDDVVGYCICMRETADKELTTSQKMQNSIKSAFDNVYFVEFWRDLLEPSVSMPNNVRSLRYSLSKYEVRDKDGENMEPFWHIASIGVDPAHQRKGVGQAIIQYVLDMAAKEGMRAGLYSTPIGQRLYKKLGFREVGTWQWWKGDGPNSRLTIMRWEPPTAAGEKGADEAVV